MKRATRGAAKRPSDERMVASITITLPEPVPAAQADGLRLALRKVAPADCVHLTWGDFRLCGRCGKAFGLSHKGARCDREYCGTACRMRAYRARRKETPT